MLTVLFSWSYFHFHILFVCLSLPWKTLSMVLCGPVVFRNDLEWWNYGITKLFLKVWQRKYPNLKKLPAHILDNNGNGLCLNKRYLRKFIWWKALQKMIIIKKKSIYLKKLRDAASYTRAQIWFKVAPSTWNWAYLWD